MVVTVAMRARRAGLLGRVVSRYRRLGFHVRVSEGRRAAARVRVDGGWLTPDFCVESRPQGIVRVGFVETGPGIPRARVDRWTRAARSETEVAVHCPARIQHLVRWWCEIRGLDLQIHAEAASPPVRRSRATPETRRPPEGVKIERSPDDVAERVLVIDDDPVLCGLVRDTLSPTGMEVHDAADGAEALAVAEGLRPDVVLCDVLLPGMSGFTLCRRLRALPALRDVPIIVITAVADRSALPAAFDAGAVDFLRKPFDAVELVARVRAHVATRRRIGTVEP